MKFYLGAFWWRVGGRKVRSSNPLSLEKYPSEYHVQLEQILSI
jgi:hypothetical protein